MTEPTKQLNPPSKETPRQREAFLIYFNLGNDRSILMVGKELAKKGIKISQTSIKKWSAKYKWVERVQTMDTEVQSRAEEIAISEATVKKSDILKAVKNTMIKYNQALLAGEIVPTAKDFHQMWEIQRKELGKDIEVASPINLVINQKILNVVRKAEDEALEIIKQEIEDEQP